MSVRVPPIEATPALISGSLGVPSWLNKAATILNSNLVAIQKDLPSIKSQDNFTV